MKKTALLLLVFALTGCLSTMDQFAIQECKDSMGFTSMLTGEYDRCIDRKKANFICSEQGYSLGTSDYKNCVSRIESEQRIIREVKKQTQRIKSEIEFQGGR